MAKLLMVAAAVLLIGTSAAVAGPLQDAVKSRDLARLTELVEAGEDLTAQDVIAGTALHWAALIDNIDAVRLLIDAGADIEARSDSTGTTPLMQAAAGNSAGAVELLVAAGAEIDAKAPSGQTALYWAAVRGSADALRKLIELGADVNGAPETEPVFRSTPLAEAIARKRAEIADILREAGASE